MKRGNQPLHLQQGIDAAEIPLVKNDYGVDAPAEKEGHKHDTDDAPPMGALPADTLGSSNNRESGTAWTGSALDETHTATESDVNDEQNIVAVGTGPDPENMED